MTAGDSKAALTITPQPAPAPSTKPRPAPAARALPPGLVAQVGQNWTPIVGQNWMPIDTGDAARTAPVLYRVPQARRVVRRRGGGLSAALHEPECAEKARPPGHSVAVGAGRALALCAHDDVTLRPGESAAAGDGAGGERGRGAAWVRQDRRGRRAEVAAGTSLLHHATT